MGENNNKSLEKDNGSLALSWLALIVVVIGTFMSALDSSIVNIAVPKMMAVFGMSMNSAKWILTGYTLALGAIIPLTGYLQEVFGSKRVYMFALSVFTMGSMLCGFAWSSTTIILFRVIQAIGGGMIMPVGMSMIYEIFPREKIGLALGIWGISSMAAPAIGPTLGGYIIQNMDWRLIFNLNVPIGVIGVTLAGILLKSSEIKLSKSFDVIGFLSSTVGFVSLLYVLGESSSIDWNNVKYPILIVLGVLSLVLFVVNELTHPDPLLDLSIFKLFNFTASQIIGCILTLALMGGMYVMPLFLENIRGYTAMQTGMIMFPAAVVVGLLMPISGALFDKVGVKPVAVPGLIILGVASFMLGSALNMNSSKSYIILILCVRSVGMGIAMMPINTIGMNAVPNELVGNASALASTIKQVSGSVSVTIMSTIMDSRTNYNYLKLSEQITSFNKSAMDTINSFSYAFMHAGQPQGTAHATAISYIAQLIQGQATLDAMAYAVIVTSSAVILALVLTFIIREEKKSKKPSKEGAFKENEKRGTVTE
ncbi:DHA2 family efflux MFS transporter permease subunit [Clostridium fermenticellae]|uniref:DHA2 family efflux MFS transporter permease subunit n=1 Tax=Clostridium fermenticellae TaxID=2068654 RepID=UPI0018F8ABD4|nr:DHA2 family efflux MFS transporter permease subunit [Clostridium fermenticellae]